MHQINGEIRKLFRQKWIHWNIKLTIPFCFNVWKLGNIVLISARKKWTLLLM